MFRADASGVGGASETVIGAWLAARPGMRDRVRLSTKVAQNPLVAHQWPQTAEGLAPDRIRVALAGSLSRLRVDHIDLYWAHTDDRAVPLTDQVRTLGDLVLEGTVAAVGASNWPAWRVEQARNYAAGAGLPGMSAVQLRHSSVQPRPGAALPDAGHVIASPEQLDHAATERLTVWAYSPLLNGSYTRADRPLPEAYHHPGTTRRLAVLSELAHEVGATPNQVVLAWLLGGTPAVSPTLGVSTLDQLGEAMAARDLTLTSEQRHRLDSTA